MANSIGSKRAVSFRTGNDVFHVGDIVEVEADGEEQPFVGELLAKSKRRKNFGKVIRVRWYYRKDEVKGGSASWMGKKELFKGKFHTDEIAIAAVNRKLQLRMIRNADEWRKEFKDAAFVRFDYDAKALVVDFGSGWPLDAAGHPANPDSWEPKRSARLPVAPWPEHLLAKASPQVVRELESLGVGDIVKHGMSRTVSGSGANSAAGTQDGSESDSDSDSSSVQAASPTPEQKEALEAEQASAAARAERIARRHSAQWESPPDSPAASRPSALGGDSGRSSSGEDVVAAAPAPSSAPATPTPPAKAAHAKGKADSAAAAPMDSASASQSTSAASSPAPALRRGVKRSRLPAGQPPPQQARKKPARTPTARTRGGGMPSPKRKTSVKQPTHQGSAAPGEEPAGASAAVPFRAKANTPEDGSSDTSSKRSSLAGKHDSAPGAADSTASPHSVATQAVAGISSVDLLQWLFPRARQQPPVHGEAAAAAAAAEAGGASGGVPEKDGTLLSLRPFTCPDFQHVTQVVQRVTAASDGSTSLVTGFTSTSTTPTTAPVDEEWQALCNQQAATRIICELHGRLLGLQYHHSKAVGSGVHSGSTLQQRAVAMAAAAKYRAGEELIVKHMKQQLHLLPQALRPVFAAVCETGAGDKGLPSLGAVLQPPSSSTPSAQATPPPGSVRSHAGSVASYQSAAVSVAQPGGVAGGGRQARRSAAVIMPQPRPQGQGQGQPGMAHMQPAIYSTNAALTGYTGEASQGMTQGAHAWQAPQGHPGMPYAHPGYMHMGQDHSAGLCPGHSSAYSAAPFAGGVAGGYGPYMGSDGYAGSMQPGMPPMAYNPYQPVPSAGAAGYLAYMKQKNEGWSGQ